MKKVLILGAGGFIGQHLARRLEQDGDEVTRLGRNFDLRDLEDCYDALAPRYDEIYQLAADMGGAGYTFSGDNDAKILGNSLQINLNVARTAAHYGGRVFFASSACVYPPGVTVCEESLAYPAAPDSDYGWEKLTSERLYAAYARNHGMEVRIGRLHTIYGPGCAWQGGKEKALAALCRKVVEVDEGGTIEVWGDGRQMRSFLHIDDGIEAIMRLMRSDYGRPMNIGSNELVSINQLVALIGQIARKTFSVNNISGPLGVRARSSHNGLISAVLDWEPQVSLVDGVAETYHWVEEQMRNAR